MSLADSILTPIKGQLSVEPIDGATNAKRITRRFTGPGEYLQNSARLLDVIEPYGTADGVSVGAAANRQTPPGEKVWPDAFLVEVRALPMANQPEKCLVEKVYEQTPYTTSDTTDYDAEGSITRRQRSVVLSVGQDPDAVVPEPPGFTRTTVSLGTELGRCRYSLTDVRGDGLISTAASDDGEMATLSVTTAYPTEPAAPTAGTYLSYSKTAQAGYWLLTVRTRVNDTGTVDRVRREQQAREDGSIVETATLTGSVPTTSLTGAVYLIRSSESTVAAGLKTYGRTWIKPPADWSYVDNVSWTLPGLVELVGTTDVSVRVRPPVQRVYAGTIATSYGTSKTPDVPWQILEACAWQVSARVNGDAANDVPGATISQVQASSGCVGEFASTGASKYQGMDVSQCAITGSSSPTTRPTGATLIDSDVKPYLVDLAGVRVFEKRNTTITV